MPWPRLLVGIVAFLGGVGCRAALGIEELKMEEGASDGGGSQGSGGTAGAPQGPASERRQSCARLDHECGNDGTRDCCAMSGVDGGTFNRFNDPNVPATVSYFLLDTFEVTLGRMRAFADSGYGTQENPPLPESGAHPRIQGSGWRSAWDGFLPPDRDALRDALACTSDYPVWTAEPGANEYLPMNCVDWYLAFAFCVWDGNRLPTDAEWNYAAAGGAAQRLYPWGSEAPDPTRAAYDCLADGEPRPSCTLADVSRVGSFPSGDGYFGNADLGGNITEWTLDAFGNVPPNCIDCASLEDSPARVVRGGSFSNGSDSLRTSERDAVTPEVSPANVGVRCARTP